MMILAPCLGSTAIGTAFTYQGQLKKDGQRVEAVCDFEFRLWDDSVAGNPIGTPVSKPGQQVTEGLFTVNLDFGEGAINGEARWLRVSVQCPGDPAFVILDQRQALTPAAYSIRAGKGVGGPNALNVTPSGDVGIGTTSPAAQLDVNGAARTTTLEITGGSPFVPPLAAWGDNGYGQTDVPFDTVAPVMFTTVAAGDSHSLAIRSDGTLLAFGKNGAGQTDTPSGAFVAVAAGGDHSLAIRSDGTLVGWGLNSNGQTDVPSGTFVAVSAGHAHSLAVRSDGTLVGWGLNSDGQTNVPAGTFTAVAAGYAHSLAIRSDGTLVGWGGNGLGQIDNIPSGTFTTLAAGAFHSLAIRSDGTLAGWGHNSGSGGQTDVPVGTFTSIAAGGYHSLAIRDDGTLVGWGDSSYGEINVPNGTFTAVAAGLNYGLAILSNPPTQDPALYLHTDSAIKPGSNTWTIFSDRRLKKNIEPLSGALERLLQLRGVTFHWLDPASQGGDTRTQMGLIADEVQRAFPQWVGRDAKGYQTLTVSGFEALTAEALRELRAEKDREIAELQDRNRQLEERFTILERILANGGSSPSQLPP